MLSIAQASSISSGKLRQVSNKSVLVRLAQGEYLKAFTSFEKRVAALRARANIGGKRVTKYKRLLGHYFNTVFLFLGIAVSTLILNFGGIQSGYHAEGVMKVK